MMHDGPIHFADGTAPEWIVYTFTGINVVISLSYGLLAMFFATRLKLPGKQTNRLSLLACLGAMFFFIGCAHTHIDLAYWSGTGGLREHWFSWWNVLSHLLQAVGGLTFWVLATFFLQINIFDKRHYEQTLSGHGSSTDPQPGDDPVDDV